MNEQSRYTVNIGYTRHKRLIKKEKKERKKKDTMWCCKGANSLASIFLGRRVQLIVASERLGIFRKCFHQSGVKWFSFPGRPQLLVWASELLRCHTRTRTKLREGPKSYKRWVDHFPSVYRLSHAWASHFD